MYFISACMALHNLFNTFITNALNIKEISWCIDWKLLFGISFFNWKWCVNGQNPRIDDNNIGNRLVTLISWCSFYTSNDVHSLDDFSENNVTIVQPWCFLGCDEELTSVGVFSSISHWEPAATVMLQLEVLIRESFAINWSTSSTIALCEISTLIKY